jgi:hypothetical protein
MLVALLCFRTSSFPTVRAFAADVNNEEPDVLARVEPPRLALNPGRVLRLMPAGPRAVSVCGGSVLQNDPLETAVAEDGLEKHLERVISMQQDAVHSPA